MPELPHGFPFRWVTGGGDAPPRIQPGVGDALPWRGGGFDRPFPLSLAVEAMAQAALAALPPAGGAGDEGAAGGAVFLAGIDGARMLAPIWPGDRLEAGATIEGRFGPAIKVACHLDRRSGASAERVAEARLLLALE